jgi:N-acetylmuramoyl-L-alanine amidase
MINLKIYLSPSDQLSNPYAYGGTNEARQCRKIAAACKTALERNGFEVKTSFADGSNAMYERVRESNAWGADVHVCIHTNAGGGRGCVVFVASKSSERMKYAQPVFDAIDAITPYRSVYGIREKQFYEIRNTTGTCIYCECEFHDSPDTARWIVEHTDDIGEAICRGICRAAGRNYIEKGSENDMIRWERLEDIPAGYREMAQRFVDAGALHGKDGGKLDITEDMLRTMEIMRRYFEREA